jgi:hypothetical protein
VDVFDLTTGAVRTGGTDDIACWFIDSDYDGQSLGGGQKCCPKWREESDRSALSIG